MADAPKPLRKLQCKLLSGNKIGVDVFAGDKVSDGLSTQ
jgi:hypothetical protein